MTDYADAELVDADDLLALDCDVLVPAALEGAIDAPQAERIQARLIAEAANGPVTEAADEVLTDREIIVIPDVLASAGGVTVSCFEWQQNLAGEQWSADKVARQLTDRMSTSLHDVWRVAEQRSLTMRTAAMVLGVERIAKAVQQRGVAVAEEAAS